MTIPDITDRTSHKGVSRTDGPIGVGLPSVPFIAVSTPQPDMRAGARYRSRLAWVFALVIVVMVVEIVVGVATNSLALISDAGHMATDALGLGMALAAVIAASRAHSVGSRTFGLYRLEILAALANALLLAGVAGYVLFEAFDRLGDPPEISTGPVLIAASIGLVVNLLGWWLLREGASESINVEGAFLEVVADLWGSLGVLVAALIVRTTGWLQADALAATAIAIFIIPRAFRLGRSALRILVQAAPAHLDLDRLRDDLGALEGVVDVHDLHVWTLTSDMDVASVHLMIPDGTDAHPVLDRARHLLKSEHGIAHATLQVEPESHVGCREISW